MRYIIKGRNVEVTEGLKSSVTAKIGKLDKYFTQETEAYVTLSVEKERQKVEVTIPMKGNTLRAEETNSDMYVSIDMDKKNYLNYFTCFVCLFFTFFF